jgi:cell division protein ZapA (FtsZ GTPase activity inhibitor)
MKSQSIEVGLLGQRISLKTQGDPETVKEVVDLVSSKLREAEKRGKSPAPHHIALIALMELAHEYIQAKKLVAEHHQAMDEKSRELFSLLETEFRSDH